ncbi:MAG: twin-arginine translocation signal domain-containing protein, partial [Caulobacteraceae bacterium]
MAEAGAAEEREVITRGYPPTSRRDFVQGMALVGGGAAMGTPIWTRAQGAEAGAGVLTGDKID